MHNVRLRDRRRNPRSTSAYNIGSRALCARGLDREVKSLLRQIKTENAIFINTCEALLTGIVRVDQMTLFLKNPGGQVWRDPKIEKKLEERLKGAYEGYAETVVDMKAVLEKFMEKLMLDPAGKVG